MMPTASKEKAEAALETLSAATAANQTTHSRHGNVILLDAEAGEDVMITADLHGHRSNYDRILEIADLEGRPRRHLVMQEVCHGGPFYDGTYACRSHLMLLDVAQLKAQYPERFHFLLSNHELAELTDHPIAKDGKMLTLSFRFGIAEEFGDAADEVHAAYMAFIRSCPLGVRLPGNVFICHSAPENVDDEGFDATVFDRELEDRDLRRGGDVFRLLWGRDYREANADAFAEAAGAEVFIHGHTPCEKGYNVPNRRQIILDCCSDAAGYVILPLQEKLDIDAIVGRIEQLND